MKDVTSSPSYRAAFDEACAEIDQLLARMTQLQARREIVEKAVEVLKLVVDPGQAVDQSHPQASFASVEPRPIPSVEPRPIPIQKSVTPSRLSSDRIQDHIDSVLRTLATA